MHEGDGTSGATRFGDGTGGRLLLAVDQEARARASEERARMAWVLLQRGCQAEAARAFSAWLACREGHLRAAGGLLSEMAECAAGGGGPRVPADRGAP